MLCAATWCSGEHEPGPVAVPHGELLPILVTFLGMEQLISVLKKTHCDQGLCFLALVIPTVAFT